MLFFVWGFVSMAACATAITCGSHFSDTSGGATNYTVSNCAFNSIAQTSSSANGGAICIAISSTCALTIVYSSFFNCSSGNYGGAVYFSGGVIIVNNTCASNCAAALQGQFMYSTASAHTSVYSTSYGKCAAGYISSSTAYSLILFGGVGDVLRINSTNNFVSIWGGAIFFSSSMADNLLFANIVNCSANGSVVDFYTVTQLGSFSYSNVVNCTSGSSYGIVISTDPISVSFCVFKGIISSYIFCGYSSLMYVSNCWIDFSGTVITGSVVTVGCDRITTNTLALGKCGCATKSNGFTYYQTGPYTPEHFILLMIILLQ